MKEIPLTKGKSAKVDDSDFDVLSKFKWHFSSHGYAARSVRTANKKQIVYMHRVIAETPGGMTTDHINGDGTDNRKENLRTCSNGQNLMNRGPQSNNSHGFKGVFRNGLRWTARICSEGTTYRLGNYKTPEEAHAAYCGAAAIHHKQFSKTS